MTAMVSASSRHTNCCTATAAACTSARISGILDTAIIMVVSIFVCLISLRLRA